MRRQLGSIHELGERVLQLPSTQSLSPRLSRTRRQVVWGARQSRSSSLCSLQVWASGLLFEGWAKAGANTLPQPAEAFYQLRSVSMSEEDAEEIENITISLGTLSISRRRIRRRDGVEVTDVHVQEHPLPGSSRRAPEATAPAASATLATPDPAPTYQSVPLWLLQTASRLRTVGDYSPRDRICRAFAAGVRASHVLEGHVEPAFPDIADTADPFQRVYWVVLRIRPGRDGSPCICTTRARFLQLVGTDGFLPSVGGAVWHPFQSLTEVDAYVAGAGFRNLPRLP